MLKAVIFDLDNTLIDFLKMKRLSCEAAVDAMQDAGLNMPKEDALKIIYEIYDKYGMEDQKIFQRFMKKTLKKVDYRMLAYAIIAYKKVKEGFLTPYPRTKRTLIKLKESGLKLAIVSDAPRLQVWTRLVSIGLDDFFDAVVAFEDTKMRKPLALPFKKVLQILKVRANECLMVGDIPEKDIKGANAIGMKTCFARYGSTTQSHIKPDFSIDKIEELVRVVELLR